MSKTVDDLRIVSVTCPDEATALAIARLVVDRRLAACANIVPGVRSVYRWMGEISEDSEVLLTMKTREDFVDSLFTTIVAEKLSALSPARAVADSTLSSETVGVLRSDPSAIICSSEFAKPSRSDRACATALTRA